MWQASTLGKQPTSTEVEPLYLGFDLSTQQLKGLAVKADLGVVHEATFDFDADSRGYGVRKGVLTNETEHEVFTPVGLWLQALDGVLMKLKGQGIDFGSVKCISGAGMQHGSVFWSKHGEDVLGALESSKTLEDQFDAAAFAHRFSPNWQDASTEKECGEFNEHLGGPEELARCTGSKAHHILRHQRKHGAFEASSRISLVSSFLASIFLGRVAPIDISDVCGTNLWDIEAGNYHQGLLGLASGGSPDELAGKLGAVSLDPSGTLGRISGYFVGRYGFSSYCAIAPFTGDNPSTILALPLQPLDAIVSLGTSTTFLMSTPTYAPDPSVHFFNHPTTPGLYMFMLCYKNGGLAREQIRDAVNRGGSRSESWARFDEHAENTPVLGQENEEGRMRLGLYFPRPEIVPNVGAGTWRFRYDPVAKRLAEEQETPDGTSDARAIIESQLLSLRLRSKALVSSSPAKGLPPQPRRIYLVGGGSANRTIAKIAGEVLGGAEGVYTLDVGGNACALGAAYRAVWAVEGREGEGFEDFIGKAWHEEDFVKRVAEGYQKGVWERYGAALEGFELMERRVLEEEHRGELVT